MKILPILTVLFTANFLHAGEAAQPEPQAPSEHAKARKANPQKAKKESYPADVPKPTHAGVKYGPHPRHVFDFWQAKSDKPTPLVLVIHGGGWNSGSKERANGIAKIKALLDAGISVAANNYRYVPQAVAEGVTPPVKAPMDDCARALQFLRSKAAGWNIDPARVAAAGSSAGACTSLWLAYHDDLADPESADPVARRSTRLLCAAVIGAQTTLDPRQAKEWTPNSRYGGHAFGKKSFAEALAARDRILPWIAEYSPYALASKDDPPVALFYAKPPAMGKKEADPTHSANFGVGLQQRCKELGIGCEFVHPGTPDAKDKTPTDYLIRMLTGK
jgi:acetyl esterase/lipase